MNELTTTNVEIGGSDQVGSVTAPGRGVDLDGTLNITLTNGFVPAPCESFPIMSWGDAVGSFATVNGPDLSGAQTFTAHYLANGLEVTAPPSNPGECED